MWVTCYTDASFSKQSGGTWAVWLRSDDGRIVRSGRCPDYVNDSTSAEMAAIYAGVFLALREWPSVSGVHVRSDSQAALSHARPDARPSRHAGTRTLQDKLRALIAAQRIELSLRWVKGHQPAGAGTAAWLNRNCDRRAQKLRRAFLHFARSESR